MKYDVITVGWIHTHPGFDLFLSAVDLHNQLGYQQQLSEAIAIVYSPIDKSGPYKSFRVKDAEIPAISKCKGTGFHEHKDAYGQPSWEVCSHVQYVNSGYKIKLIDLR